MWGIIGVLLFSRSGKRRGPPVALRASEDTFALLHGGASNQSVEERIVLLHDLAELRPLTFEGRVVRVALQHL